MGFVWYDRGWSETRRDVAQSGSALGWGPSGRRFKSGRPDCLWLDRTAASLERRTLDTLYLLMGIIGFFLIIALFFFGGFVLLDFLWGRRGGDL
jgi:hypothetical protein